MKFINVGFGNMVAADRIVVLADGRVAEEGRPNDLLDDEDSMFRHMAQLQAASGSWSI